MSSISRKEFTNQCFCLQDEEITTIQKPDGTWITEDPTAISPLCGHGAHKVCVEEYFESRPYDLPKCPSCRKVDWLKTEDIPPHRRPNFIKDCFHRYTPLLSYLAGEAMGWDSLRTIGICTGFGTAFGEFFALLLKQKEMHNDLDLEMIKKFPIDGYTISLAYSAITEFLPLDIQTVLLTALVGHAVIEGAHRLSNKKSFEMHGRFLSGLIAAAIAEDNIIEGGIASVISAILFRALDFSRR